MFERGTLEVLRENALENSGILPPALPTFDIGLPEWLGMPDMFSREELESQDASMAGAFFER